MIFFKHSKIWDVTNLPPLKGISSPRFEEARKEDGSGISGFGQLGGLPPLKETFVGSLELLSSVDFHLWFTPFSVKTASFLTKLSWLVKTSSCRIVSSSRGMRFILTVYLMFWQHLPHIGL